MKTKTCITCKQPFDFDPAIYDWRTPDPDGTRQSHYPDTCEPCIKSYCEQVNREAQTAKEAAEREKQWRNTGMPLYRSSDVSRFPPALRDAVTGHDLASNIGLGLVGKAGTQKTRAAYVLLRRYLDAGHRIYAINSPDLAAAAANQFADKPTRGDFDLKTPTDIGAIARRTLDACRTIDVLLIDDIGKAKMSDRAELELFTVLETRTANMLPTVWTSNASSSELAAMFSDDRRDPIMRRLVEFSTIIATGGMPA